MTKDKGIFIKNIYYMLAYAYQVLKQKNYEEIASEEFEDIQDLFAAILSKGISQQLKQGLHKEYVPMQEDMLTLRGKINIHGSMRNMYMRKKALACEYDELSIDNTFNKIIKTTILVLIRESAVKKENKDKLKKVLVYFDEVGTLKPDEIKWSSLRYQRNNKSYEMLMNLCYFALEGMIQTTDKGIYKMATFSDEHMHKLFEKFVLEYYKRHHNYLSDVRAAQIKWDIKDNVDESMKKFLPTMQTDVFLRYKEKILIIDTKYYSHTMQSKYDKESLHSNNFYQIFTYVKNEDKEGIGNVSGMVLYAMTNENITPDCSYEIGGNRICFKSLDLNKEFKEITRQLDDIVKNIFEISQESMAYLMTNYS